LSKKTILPVAGVGGVMGVGVGFATGIPVGVGCTGPGVGEVVGIVYIGTIPKFAVVTVPTKGVKE
jgi:hypothetical protein